MPMYEDDYMNQMALEEARNRAANMATVADVGQALAGMATAQSVGRGGPGADRSIYEGIRQRAANIPRQAEEDRKTQIANYIMNKRMSDEEKQRAEAMKYRTERDTKEEGRYQEGLGMKREQIAYEKEQDAKAEAERNRRLDLMERGLDLKGTQHEVVDPVTGEKKVVATPEKPLTEAQAKIGNLWSKAVSGNDSINALETKGLTAPTGMIKQIAMEKYITAEGLEKQLAAKALTAEEIQFANANQEFIGAIVRNETGAAIKPEEFRMYQYLIPQKGDTPEILKQKRSKRELQLKSLGIGASEGYTKKMAPSKSDLDETKQEVSDFRPYSPDITDDDREALNFIQIPENKNHRAYPSIVNKLKAKGLL